MKKILIPFLILAVFAGACKSAKLEFLKSFCIIWLLILDGF